MAPPRTSNPEPQGGLINLRLLSACLVSVAVILAAPFMGQIRAALQSAFPKRFVVIVAGSVALAIGAAVLTALARIRERRAARFGAIAAALAAGVAYSLASGTGRPEVDVVERVHFVEYGLITLLFYRAWRSTGGLSAFLLPLFAALIVGTLDEWLQWFIPVRVGEARDVFLNLAAIGCGLLFGWAIDPPPALGRRELRGSIAGAGLAATAFLLVFAAFVSTVHLGQAVDADGIGSFKSHYSAGRLAVLARERAERWRSEPPVRLRRLSREDQYMDEGLWHVRRRNERWAAGDYPRAWKENLILEGYFAPVLDFPSYASPHGNRWVPEQRADAQQRGGDTTTPFVSDAEPYPILAWPSQIFWTLAGLGAVSIVAVTFWLDSGSDKRSGE